MNDGSKRSFDALAAVGYGSPNTDTHGRALNRRVEVRVLVHSEPQQDGATVPVTHDGVEAESAEHCMTGPKFKKCAHIACLCDVRDEEEYCGDICRARGRDNVEIACQCDHLECPCVVAVAIALGQLRHQEK